MTEEQKIHRVTLCYEIGDTKSKQVAEKNYGTGTEEFNSKGDKCFACVSVAYVNDVDFDAQVKNHSTDVYINALQELQSLVKMAAKTMQDPNLKPIIEHDALRAEAKSPAQAQAPTQPAKPLEKPSKEEMERDAKENYHEPGRTQKPYGPSYTQNGKLYDEPVKKRSFEKEMNDGQGSPDGERDYEGETRDIIRKYLLDGGYKEGDYGFSKKVGADYWNVNISKEGLGVYSNIARKNPQTGEKTKIKFEDAEFPESFRDVTRTCDALVAKARIEG